MKDLEYIQSQIDQTIDQTMTQLKVEAVANMVYKLNKEQNLNDVAIDLSVHEKRMRRDCFYQPDQCFKEAFTAQIHDQKHNTLVDLKEEFKDVFMFGMNNRPTKFYMEVSFDIEKYDASRLVSKLINQGFFHEAGNTKTPETLFAEVLIRLSAKGEFISGYSYQKPESVPMLFDTSGEVTTQELHDQLMKALEPKPKEEKPVDPNALFKIYKGRI